jgi:hypothetical protein
MKNHLLAARALMPEIIRHLLAAKQGTDLWSDKFGEPAHGVRIKPFGRVGKDQGAPREASSRYLKKAAQKLLLLCFAAPRA